MVVINCNRRDVQVRHEPLVTSYVHRNPVVSLQLVLQGGVVTQPLRRQRTLELTAAYV